jgi:hypothetical protein
MTQDHTDYLWYIRRNGEVQGPFPRGLISNYILVGRINDQVELSTDQEHWAPPSAHPELVPEVMRHTATALDRERLELARLHQDERRGSERRCAATGEVRERRGRDRREEESQPVAAHRTVKRLLTVLPDDASRRTAVAAVVSLAALVAAAFVAASWLFPTAMVAPPECAAAPRMGINWSHCHLSRRNFYYADLRNARIDNAHLEGAGLVWARLQHADLSYANLAGARLNQADLRAATLVGAILRGADLRNAALDGADLAYADLQGAKLVQARLNDARLGHAIWTDGRHCGAESVGRCAP